MCYIIGGNYVNSLLVIFLIFLSYLISSVSLHNSSHRVSQSCIGIGKRLTPVSVTGHLLHAVCRARAENPSASYLPFIRGVQSSSEGRPDITLFKTSCDNRMLALCLRRQYGEHLVQGRSVSLSLTILYAPGSLKV